MTDVLHFYCGECGKSFEPPGLHGQPVCLALHPKCVVFGTAAEAEVKRVKYANRTVRAPMREDRPIQRSVRKKRR